jgi:hypothetical protein
MTEAVWLACPICGHDLVAAADVPAIRQLAVRCPACIDLLVTVLLERTQPDNPYVPAGITGQREDPDGWRVQSVLAGRTPRAAWRRRKKRGMG